MSIAMEGEIVDISVRLSYFKTGPSFAGLMWLVVGNSEGKERFCS